MDHSLHYHTVLKASPGMAIFGRDMLFDIPFIADWNKIGDYRQHQINLSTAWENKNHINYDYKIVDRVQVIQGGTLRKAQSPHGNEPWPIKGSYHAEITATSGPVVAVLLHCIGARGARDVTRAPYWGPRGARCNL